MPNTAQAQADLPEDTQTVDDPLDAPNNPKGANEFADYEAAREALLNAPPQEEEQGEEPAPQEDVEERQEEAQAEDGGQEELPDDTDAGEQPEETKPESGRFRIRAKDDIEIEALSLRKRHPEWSLKECLAKAEQLLGTPAAESEEAGQDGRGETVESVTAAMADLKTKRKEAFAALEFEAAAELDDQYEALRDKREELRVREAEEKSKAEKAARQQFDEEYAKSERITAAHYPEALKADSKLTKRMIELDAQMLELGDPLYHSPKKPFLLAKMAAAELGVPMVRPNAKPAAPTSTKGPGMQPASGNARTTSTQAPSKLAEQIAQASTLEEYERLVGRG